MDDGIGEVAQLISVSFNGLKIGADLSLEALRLLKRMASVLYHAMQAVPYRKTIGKTNMGNMKARMGEDLQYVSMSPEVYQKFRKFAKKSGILYAKLPDFNGEGRVFLAVSQNAGPLLQEFLNSMEKQYVRSKAKAGEDETVFKKENTEISMQEYYAASGCRTVSDEEFCRKMAKEYPASFHQEEEMEHWQKKSLPVTGEQAKIGEALLKNKDRELMARENSFVLNFARTQVVGMNENQYKVHIGNTSSDCVWVDKDKVAVAGNGICRAVIGNQEELLVSDLEDEQPFRKIRGNDFLEELRLARQKEEGSGLLGRIRMKMKQFGEQKGQTGQRDAGNSPIIQESVAWINQKNQAEKNWITISKENIQETAGNSILFRIPNTRGLEYLWLDKKDLKEVHNGKSYAYQMDRGRKYEISYADGEVCGNMQGSELVDRHFDIKDEKLKNVPASKARKR